MTPADASLRARRAAALASWVAVGLCLLAASLVSAEEARRAVPDALVQKASAEGRVRVIVELGGAGAVPESELSSVTAVAGQRARIAADRASVRAALRGLGHRVLHEFKTIPYMGLEVDPDALRMLGALPGLATRVHEDTLVRPALAQPVQEEALAGLQAVDVPGGDAHCGSAGQTFAITWSAKRLSASSFCSRVCVSFS